VGFFSLGSARRCSFSAFLKRALELQAQLVSSLHPTLEIETSYFLKIKSKLAVKLEILIKLYFFNRQLKTSTNAEAGADKIG